MRIISTKSLVAALILCSGLYSSAIAHADTITWTNWSGSAGHPGSGSGQTSVVGTLALGSGITVTYTGQLNGVTNEPNWNSATYHGGDVDNSAPKNFDSIVEGINNGGTQTETFTFSQAVVDPVISLWSIGNSAKSITLNFTATGPFSLESCGAGINYGGGCITTSGDIVSGKEGNGTIEFFGDYTSITFTVPKSEFYYALQIGALELVPPPPPPATVPEPSALVLMSTGLMGLVGAGRKKFFKA